MFDYTLPKEKIAQRPAHPYDAAKLLVYERKSGKISDSSFSELPKFLNSTDCLVFNDSKVIPARLFGKIQGNAAPVEILLLQELNADSWLCMGKPMRKLDIGTRIEFSNELQAEVFERSGAMELKLIFKTAPGQELKQALFTCGKMPIPPYIRHGQGDEQDKIDYQSLMADKPGSIAAPTASLHFTNNLLEEISKLGCSIERLTLHIGRPSIIAAWVDDAQSQELQAPGAEQLVFNKNLLQRLKQRGNSRLICVGTTTVRALESMFHENNLSQVHDGDLIATDLFIYPGHAAPKKDFQITDCLITNFHLPKSTHLLMVEALIGTSAINKVYQHALDNNYRFLSYGDGMLII